MRITVFGATGGTGRHLVRLALDAGHRVTAVVRDPARLPDADRPGLTTVIADSMDPDAISASVTGADAVVSTLGARARTDTTVCADGARAISTAMRAAGARRLVVVTAAGPVVDEGDGPLTRGVYKPLLRLFLRDTFADFTRAEQVVSGSGLDWTIVRPPRLTRGGHRRYRTALDRNVRGGTALSRADLAHALLATLDDPATVGHTLAVGY
ncbi:NAD(P)-dependent oxidoreductase [Micromonospora sp. WMMA1923]|uniref:NAD(P)-dependent oxidoreductase n=1 Tax=Micromonospora sp. WMMA1923 TaxID=3404125 RepID=UPI003B924FD2